MAFILTCFLNFTIAFKVGVCILSFRQLTFSDYEIFKVVLSPSKQLVFHKFNKNPLKMMKNEILKYEIVLEIFKFFVLTFWLYRKMS